MHGMRLSLVLSTLVALGAAASSSASASASVSSTTSASFQDTTQPSSPVAPVPNLPTSSCTQATITISTAAQATLPCNVANTLLITDPTITNIDIEGPTQIGALIIDRASALVSVTSSSLTAITGLFSMSKLDALSNVQLSSLTSVGAINWVALSQLNSVTFGTQGVTQVEGNITISDTFFDDLDGLNIASTNNIDINNNRKLVEWTSSLSTINGTLKLQNNGAGQIVISMPNLTAVGDIQVRDVKSFVVPILSTIGLGLDFEENTYMVNFSAPKLDSVSLVSFVDNAALTNISIPKLTLTSNAFTIQNNTKLDILDGFPNLSTIRGAMILRGSFSQVELPALLNVFGEGVITSTKDISSSCVFFNNLIANKDIQGEGSVCSSLNNQANTGGNNGTTNTPGSGGNSNSSSSSGAMAGSLFSYSSDVVLFLSLAAGLLMGLF